MFNGLVIGQFLPCDSFIHSLDPRTKILGTIIYIIALFLTKNLAGYLFLTAFAVMVITLSRLPVILILKSLKPVLFILLITFVIHALSFPGTEIVWQWSFLTITAEGIRMGGEMILRLVLLLLFSSVLTFTTSPVVLMDGIEKLLAPLRKLGVPAHEIAMMMTIALRFIPTLMEETDRIMKAQTARGAKFGEGSIRTKINSLLPLMIPLFVGAFRRADELAVAMECRCYRGGEGRSRMYELRYAAADFAAYGVLVVLLLVTCGLKLYA